MITYKLNANTDYVQKFFGGEDTGEWVSVFSNQTFKAQINADEAQLEDADGVLMSQEEAKAFVATLP